MGHQVNFFVMPADLARLETAMRTTGDVCFLADKSPTCEPVELDSVGRFHDRDKSQATLSNPG